MLARLLPKSLQFHRCLTEISSRTYFSSTSFASPNPLIAKPSRFPLPQHPHLSFFSTKGNNGGDDSATSTTDFWKMSSEADDDINSIFSMEPENTPGLDDRNGGVKGSGDERRIDMFGGGGGDWSVSDSGGDWRDSGTGGSGDIFEEAKGFGGGNEEEGVAEDYTPWSFSGEGKEEQDEDLFGGVEDIAEEMAFGRSVDAEAEDYKSEEQKQLEAEEKVLTEILKGPDRAFGDLIAASGITDEMLDSLIALKDFEGIVGLPPLSEIEEKRYVMDSKKFRRVEMARQKQEEIAKARVRKVDELGRSYGTGRRKCSVARVWLQPGDGKFFVNDKEFDVYFPMLDHRATLLRPLSETKTLGMWNIRCTVKGGGTTGQVGAIRLGISRALQNWEPGFRPPLKQAGFMKRDSRVVERKKPGKAKARKSFQWVKR